MTRSPSSPGTSPSGNFSPGSLRYLNLADVKRDIELSTALQGPTGWIERRFGETLWSKQRAIVESIRDNRYTAVPSCNVAGKGLPLDTPIPTPSGWSTIGDLRPGDEVFDERGKITRVVAVSEVWKRPCYLVEFQDGTRVVTDDGHRWSVLSLQIKNKIKMRLRGRGLPVTIDCRDEWEESVTLSTPEIADSLRTSNGQLKYSVPCNLPLSLPSADLPIHPYVLGAWLGDGTSSRAEISCHDDDIETLERILSLGENIKHTPSSHIRWSMAGEIGDRDLLYTRLRNIGVLNNKHIPGLYLRSSADQRLELLKGLMDTDGFNGRERAVGIDLCDRQLAHGVAELLRTLGCQVNAKASPAKLYGRVVGTRYRMHCTPHFNPFHLSRKRDKWDNSPASTSRSTSRTIARITPTESVETVCIQVSSRSGLYLATDRMIPTHNSFIASRAVAWWVMAHPPDEVFVVTTATTNRQIRAVLWREIGKAHARGKLPGRTNQVEWLMNMPEGDERLVAMGFKPADLDPTAFHGIHERYVLVVFDEAGGIARSIWHAAHTLVGNDESRFLAIGNPTDPVSEFAEVCKPGSGWNVIPVSAFDTPNLTGEPVHPDVAARLVSREWVEDRKRRLGEDSPIYISQVLGRFPPISMDGLIPYEWVRLAQEADLEPVPGLAISNELGVDVGGGGAGKTIIAHRLGPKVRIIKRLSDPDSQVITGHILRAMATTGATVAKIDSVGIGADLVRQGIKDGHPFVGINVGARSTSPRADEFLNVRAEAYWQLREHFSAGTIDIDPNDDDLASQLVDLNYKPSSLGKVQIESKLDMKRRGRPSPDDADAVMLAMYETVKRAPVSAVWGRR